jgi:imidazolonepropionase
MKVMKHASKIYTGQPILKKEGRKLVADDIGMIEDGAIVYSDKKIIWVGKTTSLPKVYHKLQATDLKNQQSIMPGMIDSHTHLVFAGSRAKEFARRCSGTSYQEIATEGGGILTTVQATRAASEEELYRLALQRVKIAHSFGVRTLECKSGYGLEHATEMKCLKVVKRLQKAVPFMTLVSTYMGAHAIPQNQSKAAYLDQITETTLPEVAKKKLATAVDIFLDEGYFDQADATRIFDVAKRLGLDVKVHADELKNTESAAFSAKNKAKSADHLLKISGFGISALAKSSTVATLLPGTAFYLKEPYAPARKLLDAGARVAIATDFNPGSCFSLNLPLMLNLGALYMGMNSAELFASVTYSAAAALGLEKNKGTLDQGFDSDFIVLPYPDFEEMYYRMGW